MHHNPRTDAARAFLHGGPSCCHYAARLMSGDDGAVHLTESKRGGLTSSAIELEITAAHAGGFDFDNHLARSRHWIWKFR